MPETRASQPLLTERFVCALKLALEIHGRDIRKSTAIPYMAHLLAVSALVLEYGGGEDAAIGGLLHDAVEDSKNGAETARQIREEFLDRVADIVDGCSDAVAIPDEGKEDWEPRKRAYLEHLKEDSDPDTLLVSACDKLYNARAIVADLKAIGAKLWERFTEKDPEKQLWYYESLADAYGDRIPRVLEAELKLAVAEMRLLVVAQA